MSTNKKLCLDPGMPLYIGCHNEPSKERCDQCMGCSASDCSRIYCDAHKNCQCQRTQCICLGRN